MPPDQKVTKTKKLEAVHGELDSVADLHNELELSEWYHDVEAGLLESSYDEYQ